MIEMQLKDTDPRYKPLFSKLADIMIVIDKCYDFWYSAYGHTLHCECTDSNEILEEVELFEQHLKQFFINRAYHLGEKNHE